MLAALRLCLEMSRSMRSRFAFHHSPMVSCCALLMSSEGYGSLSRLDSTLCVAELTITQFVLQWLSRVFYALSVSRDDIGKFWFQAVRCVLVVDVVAFP